MTVRNYNYSCRIGDEVAELVVKTDPKQRLVYLGDEQIAEIKGWSGRHGYRVVGSNTNSNHKSVGSAVNEAYYLYLISELQEAKARLKSLED